MEFILFETKFHYEAISAWWLKQGWPVVPLDHLPPKGCGVFLRGGDIAAAGFLYINGTALGNFEWVVADPKVRREARAEVLSLLFAGTREFAEVAGIKSIFMSTRHGSLISRLMKAGFEKTETNMTNLVAKVG